jgi:hypothetical protein
VADALDGKERPLLDFAFLRDFSYGCKQVFSGRRWAITGEAGLFLDPFYSPGSDFIAIANTYICELVERDRAGKPLDAHAQVYDQIFHSFYESTLALYTGQYPIFGDPEVLPVKVIWDYTYYWGVLSQFFFQRRLADLAAFADLKAELAMPGLNVEVQALLRDWSAARPLASVPNPAQMLDQAGLPWFAALNRSLLDSLDDAAFRERIRHGTQLMRSLAAEIADGPRRLPASPRRRCAQLLDERIAASRRGAMPPRPMLFATPPRPARRAGRKRGGLSAGRADPEPRRPSRRPQARTLSPLPPARTSPITAAASKPPARNAASTSATEPGSQLTSSPPEVCGSVSRSRATAGSAGSSATSAP